MRAPMRDPPGHNRENRCPAPGSHPRDRAWVPHEGCHRNSIPWQDFAPRSEVVRTRRGIALLPPLKEALRARRIVKIKNGRLRERVGRATAGWMERIPIEFRRPPVVRSDNERNGAGAPRHGGGVEKRLARNRPLGALRKWNQMRF